MANRRQFLSGALTGLAGIVLAKQCDAASKEDVTKTIEGLKKNGKRKKFSYEGKRATLYEKDLGKLSTDAQEYDKVTIVYKETEDRDSILCVVGIVKEKNGATFEYVFNGGEKHTLDGNPDKSLRKSYTLKELLEIITRSVSDEERLQELRKNEGKPDYSAKCLYDGAIRKFLK